MKKKNILSTVVMLLVLTSTFLCTVKLNETPASLTMTEIQFEILYVDVNDLDSGYYTFIIGVQYKRLFGTYGDRLQTDGDYNNYDFDWETYPNAIQGARDYTDDAGLEFDDSYALDRADTTDIIIVRFKLIQNAWPYHEAFITCYYGDSEMYNTPFTAPLNFAYFGGTLDVRCMIGTL